MTDKTRVIAGRNTWGEDRIYVFRLLDAVTGTKIFHRFASVVAASYGVIEPEVKKFFGIKSDEQEDQELTLFELLRLLPQVFDWDTIAELSRELLAGTKVTLPDGNEFEIGDDGMCTYSEGDPMEQYVALFYAVAANYPKYMSFFGIALDDTSKKSDEGEAAEDAQ